MKDETILYEIIDKCKDIYFKEKFPFALLWLIKDNKLLNNAPIVLLLEETPQRIKTFLTIKKHLKTNDISEYIISTNEGAIIPINQSRKNSKLNSYKDINKQTFLDNSIEKGFRKSKALIFYCITPEENKMIILPYQITDPYYNTTEVEAQIIQKLEKTEGGLIFNLN